MPALAWRVKSERAGKRQTGGVFSCLIYATAVAVFLLQAAVLFASATIASKPSRRRNPARRIVGRLKVRGFRIVNHARPIAELISVPLTDNHLDL